ncbi:hypothetical protein SISNIDRAFT_549430 [Sistotremastrum niveocremeum HHB9708]|uniref:TOM13-domain-containing protein n=1 Tax=Sistotremastrum niveocremeum HHB9708 TaxID=1314777 RepID=A0A164VL42_9AGAM|nr:hypothetical protein SISNIDRAFT_549430 [Sistotremastrum niveocremeum HHB9708]
MASSDADELLEKALANAFESAPSIPPPPTHAQTSSSAQSGSSTESPTTAQQTAPEAASSAASTSAGSASISSESGLDDSWREGYDSYVSQWRAESAIARKKAEENRAKWESVREQEAKQGKSRKDEWEDLVASRSSEQAPASKPAPAPAAAAGTDSPSVADTRGLTSGETPGGHGKERLEEVIPPPPGPTEPYPADMNEESPPASQHTRPADSLATSQQWDNVQLSGSSSFPELSFPSRSRSPSPHRAAKAVPPPVVAPPSATLTVFNSSLPKRTRLLAVASAVAINFCLPFLNGVMLGFGEIFAKQLVHWLGWKIPGGPATALGIRSGRSTRR